MNASAWREFLKPTPAEERNRQGLKKNSEVAVYGSGSIAAEIIGILRAKGMQIRFVCDGNTPRTEVQGLPITHPDTPAISRADRERLPLLLGIFNREVDVRALQEKLGEWGWSWTIDFLELHALWPENFGDRYWLTRRDFYAPHEDEIARADALWADDASRNLYRGILRLRVTGDRVGLPKPDHESSYFPPDIPAWKTPLRVIDCGAFDGDTVRSILESGLSVEAIEAFEPDPGNYAKLVETLNSARLHHGLVAEAWPCGVWRESKQLRFSPDGGEGGAVGEAGETVIECRALDDALPDFRPTLIKMDIEGAEMEALLGARKLIRESRSGLAICVYHRPDHLWRIVLLLQEWNLGYQFYLRPHGHSDFDLVLYAVAKSKP